MALAVQTHFSQGWPLSWMDGVKDAGAAAIRDGAPWASVERAPGEYQFPAALDAYMAKARNQGLRVVVAVIPSNPLYDAGQTVRSAHAVRAFAQYLNALLDRYGGTIIGVEVGNEINTKGGMTGLPYGERAQAYAQLLSQVYPAVKVRRPDVAILGGSTNVIGVGFLEDIFSAGGLAFMDGVVIHPYRQHPEGVDDELAHLEAVMAKHGAVRPIYATEFGREFDDPAMAAPHMVKMVALMGAAHVRWSSWYVLRDEPFFRNMGLLTADGSPKAAFRAFRMIESVLVPRGDPVRIDAGDAGTFIYRYGEKAYVMWGGDRPVAFSGKPLIRDAEGRTIAAPTKLADQPIVVTGDFAFKLGASPAVADSLYEFGKAPWSYFAQTPDGALHPLGLIDWEWTSYYGGRGFKPLRINADSLAPAGDGAHPLQAVERYTSSSTGPVVIEASYSLAGRGDGVSVHILHNGRAILSDMVDRKLEVKGLRVDLNAGDRLDFVVGPNRRAGGDSTSLRVRLLRAPAP